MQDHIINLVNQLDAARWTTYEALWKLDTGRSAADSVHLAKAVASEAYYQACNFAHEVHAWSRQHDRVRVDLAYQRFPHPVPLPGRPSIPPPAARRRIGFVAEILRWHKLERHRR